MKRAVLLFLSLMVILLFSGCTKITESNETNNNNISSANNSQASNNDNGQASKNENSQPSNNDNSQISNDNNSNSDVNEKLSFFFGTFQLAVPGVSFTTENSDNTETLHTSSGVQSGGIKIKTDGTYIWNSTWDGKVIIGKWKDTGADDYPILILHGEEGKDWKVGKSDQAGSDIYVWDGSSIWKTGKRNK